MQVCEGPAADADDLVTVAGMRLTQRDKLRAAGITTLTQLALQPDRPADCDIPLATYAKLHLQAHLQAGADARDPNAHPPYIVLNPDRIISLPEPSPGDLFFDFVGDPMYAELQPDGSQRWGLDYLVGWVDADGRFDALWAHDQASEAATLDRFLAFVAARSRSTPTCTSTTTPRTRRRTCSQSPRIPIVLQLLAGALRRFDFLAGPTSGAASDSLSRWSKRETSASATGTAPASIEAHATYACFGTI